MKIIVPIALGLALFAGSAMAQSSTKETAADRKQDAYVKTISAQDESHDKRQADRDKAFYAHQAKLHDALAAARLKGDQAEIARLQKIQAADEAHVQREHQANVQDAAHDARLAQMKKDEAMEDKTHK